MPSKRIEGELGGIDVLVNNAAATQRKPFLESTAEDWTLQVDVTVTGTLRVTHVVARPMARRRSGAIVNLMGDSGRVGKSGLLVTATTRASTFGLTRSLARELARYGIRANCVSIALVQTDNLGAHVGGIDDERMKKVLAQYPLRRLGRPDDVTPNGPVAGLAAVELDRRPGGVGQRRLRHGPRSGPWLVGVPLSRASEVRVWTDLVSAAFDTGRIRRVGSPRVGSEHSGRE